MSSNPSRDYYHSSQGRSARQSLPPLRSVLGDQLDLPVATPGYPSPYDLGDIYKALPPSRGTQDYRTSARSASSMSTSYADSRGSHYENPQSKRPHTYPQSSASAIQGGRHHRPMTPAYDDLHHPSNSSRNDPYGSSISSSNSRGADRNTYKKYACTWEGCDKRFERQNALDTHMNIHLEQKPFACPVPHCGKVFNVRSNMRRHLLTHKDFQGGDDDQEEDSPEDFHAHHDSGYFPSSSRAYQATGRPSSSAEKKHSSSSSHYYSSSRRL